MRSKHKSQSKESKCLDRIINSLICRSFSTVKFDESFGSALRKFGNDDKIMIPKNFQ